MHFSAFSIVNFQSCNFQLQLAMPWEGQAASIDGGHAFHVAGRDRLVSAV